MNLLYLFICFCNFTILALLCFNNTARKAWWYPLACIACSVTTSLLWSFATRRMPNNETVFRYGMYWDGAMYFAWFFTSLVLLSVRPSAMTLAGTGVMIAGIVMVKLGE